MQGMPPSAPPMNVGGAMPVDMMSMMLGMSGGQMPQMGMGNMVPVPVPYVVQVDKDGKVIPVKPKPEQQTTLQMIHKIIMLEQELDMLKREKEGDASAAQEALEAKEVDAAVGLMTGASS